MKVTTNKTWMFNNRLRGENHPNSKLKSNDVKVIRELYATGFSVNVLAKNFKVSKWNIKSIIKRQTWKHL